MAGESLHSAPRYLSALLQSGSLTGLSDAELLERFAARRNAYDEVAQLAFAALLARHGAMVMRVCRAVLKDRDESEDAFQATFLVLASRAGTIRRRDSLAAWLHGVALRVSACARARAMRRQRHERRYAEMKTHTTERESDRRAISSELDSLLQNEIARLPKRFRTAVVLCYLEGQTHEMAAAQLGCPVGTIKSRLATAREKLRRRLTHRGVEPGAIPAALSGQTLLSVSDPSDALTSIPAALVDATVHGALRIGPGKVALAGAVSSEAASLMQEVLKMTATARVIVMTMVVLVSGIASTGAGMAAFGAFGHKNGQERQKHVGVDSVQTPPPNAGVGQAADKVKASPAAVPPSKPELAKAAMVRDVQDRVKSTLAEYKSREEAFRKTIQNPPKTVEEQKARQDSRPNPAFYAGGLLQMAETVPGTPAAEEALSWIASNLVYGSMPERAKEMLARDHARSEKLEPLFNNRQTLMAGSKATEQLYRAVLAQNGHRKIQGLACFYLARFLEYQASMVRLTRLFDPAQLESATPPLWKEGWGQDYNQRLMKLDPAALEREAASLDERVLKEFADIPLEVPPPMIGSSPATLGAASKVTLYELKNLGIGTAAPETDGVDLDGKPMRLRDFQGKVVVLYFCGLRVVNGQAPITVSVREEAKRHANEPFVLLGVATAGVAPKATSPDRAEFKKAVIASGLPARFWQDPDQDGKPGRIQTAWNTRIDVYVLDHHGVIRYKHLIRPELLANAVTTLLKELAVEREQTKNKH